MNIKVDTIELLAEQGHIIPTEKSEGSDFIMSWIQKRLESLEKKITKEEKKRDCYIMIHLLPPPEQWYLPVHRQLSELRVTVNGYSSDLKDKIYHTIADGEFAKLTKVLKANNLN